MSSLRMAGKYMLSSLWVQVFFAFPVFRKGLFKGLFTFFIGCCSIIVCIALKALFTLGGFDLSTEMLRF